MIDSAPTRGVIRFNMDLLAWLQLTLKPATCRYGGSLLNVRWRAQGLAAD